MTGTKDKTREACRRCETNRDNATSVPALLRSAQ
uniref:GATA-type domain-containing protein n=1 Tax=Heterorhabditis bacteriophora TaxID=37862 RepID=A0A1I7XDU4_HETBA